MDDAGLQPGGERKDELKRKLWVGLYMHGAENACEIS